MRNQEDLKYFLSKSRKELQKLCKNHNLPANRSHAVLANSLALIFKERSANTTLPSETVVGSSNMSLNASHIPELKSIGTSHEETVRGIQEGRQSSEDYILGQTSDGTKMHGCFMPICKTVNPIESPSKDANLVVEKTLNPVNPVCPSLVNNKSSEGFDSTSAPDPTGAISQVVTDLHAPAKVDNLECFEVGNGKGHKRSLEQRNVDQKFPGHVTSDRGTSNNEMFPCGHKRARQSTTEGVSVSDAGIAKRIPSFQFFVTSERGINLYIDFRSSPLEWIKDMKNEQCMHHYAGHGESRTLSDHLSRLPDVEENVEVLPSRDVEMKLHSNGSGDNLGCTNSSLNSVVSENCNSDNSTPDVTVASSRSSILTSGATKDNLKTCLEENMVVSSSCATHVVENQLMHDPASCSDKELALAQDCAKASIKMVIGKEVAPDASLKSVACIDGMNSSPIAGDAGHAVHTACVVSGSTKATAPLGQNQVLPSDVLPTAGDADHAVHTARVVSGSTKATASLGQNQVLPTDVIPTSSTEKDGTEVLHFVNVLQDIASVEASSMRQEMDNLPCNEELLLQLPHPAQLPDQILQNPVTDAQSVVGATNNLLPEQPCGVGETLVPDDQTSKFATEMVQSIMLNKIHASECSRNPGSSEENLKASNNSEFSEASHITKDLTCKEYVNGNRASLRSFKNSSNCTASGSVPRLRRSSRLLPK